MDNEQRGGGGSKSPTAGFGQRGDRRMPFHRGRRRTPTFIDFPTAVPFLPPLSNISNPAKIGNLKSQPPPPDGMRRIMDGDRMAHERAAGDRLVGMPEAAVVGEVAVVTKQKILVAGQPPAPLARTSGRDERVVSIAIDPTRRFAGRDGRTPGRAGSRRQRDSPPPPAVSPPAFAPRSPAGTGDRRATAQSVLRTIRRGGRRLGSAAGPALRRERPPLAAGWGRFARRIPPARRSRPSTSSPAPGTRPVRWTTLHRRRHGPFRIVDGGPGCSRAGW